MTYQERLKWSMIAVFSVGFVAGQDYHTGLAAVMGFLIRLALWCFVIYTALNILHTNRTIKKEEEWKDPPSPLKVKLPSRGMGRTVAAVAGATGTHVTVLDPQKQSPSSDDPAATR